MSLDREQFCTDCGDPTGRAGNFHEALFVLVPGESDRRGPLCDACAKLLSVKHDVKIQYE